MFPETIRVVIADDNRPFTLLARSYLETSGFNVVDVVTDGRQAIETCRRNRPDVIVLDMDMAGPDGVAVADRVFHEAEGATVVVVSATTERELIDRAVELGIAHYHTKPINRDQLRACVLSAVAVDRRSRYAERRLTRRCELSMHAHATSNEFLG